MKLIVSIFFLVFTLNLTAQNTGNAAKHIGAGVVIGGAGGYAAHKLFNGQRGWTWAGAVGSSLAAGLAKEVLYDQPRGAEWESKDVLYTTLGGVLSGLTLDFIFKNSRRRGGGGNNCGCLVTQLDFYQETALPIFFANGTGDISSELQAAYFLR